MIKITTDRQDILNSNGNLLILGGPGSGKTTMGLLKAKFILESNMIKPYQQILFLSFANATISRIKNQSGVVIDNKFKGKLCTTTYHSFTWEILKSHGYLLCGKKLKILTPSRANSLLSTIVDKEGEKVRLFEQHGLVHFDLFASMCTELLKSSCSLLKIISDTFPVIFLDEFQDTNQNEWELIQELGKNSTLIVLADPDQRIYDFRGANPKRVDQFVNLYNPVIFDFKTENNRSNGTDICEYGNDILTGVNKGKTYNDVKIVKYEFRNISLIYLRIKNYIFRLISEYSSSLSGSWSIAILVPSNLLMIEISDFLSSSQNASGRTIPPVLHNVSIDMAGPAILASIIGRLFDESSKRECSTLTFTKEIARYILGKSGEKKPSLLDIKLAEFLNNYILNEKVKGKNRISIIQACEDAAIKCNNLVFTGNIVNDWILVCSLFSNPEVEIFGKIFTNLKYVKLLQKGSFLSSGLDRLWRRYGSYVGAGEVVDNALTNEHFSTSTKPLNGVNVMTIHKAKGKEFNQVIIFESLFPGRRYMYSPESLNQAKLNLRVAVTRAKEKSIILTPAYDPCPLL